MTRAIAIAGLAVLIALPPAFPAAPAPASVPTSAPASAPGSNSGSNSSSDSGSSSSPAPASDPEPLRAEILAARATGDLALAALRLDQLQHQHPGYWDANGFEYLAAVGFAEMGNAAVAERRLRKVVASRGPLAGRAAYRLATLLERSEPRAAVLLVQGFARRHPQSGLEREARVLEVVATWRSGDRARAEILLRMLKGGARREADARLLAAAREAGRRSEARDRARRILAERATDQAAADAASWLVATGTAGLKPEERWDLANALLVQRRFGPGLAELDALTVPSSRYARQNEALFLLGRSALRVGDDERARRAFERLLLAPSPWRERAHYQLGRIALQCGRRDQALDRFRDAADLAAPSGPVFGEALVKRLRLAASTDDRVELEAVFTRLGSRFAPGSRYLAEGCIAVAGAALGAGAPERALEVLSLSRPAEPDLARELAYWRGVALAVAGRPVEAGESYLLAMRGSDLIAELARTRFGGLPAEARPDPQPWLDTARAALASGDADAARRAAEAALDGGAIGYRAREASELLRAAYRALPAYAAAEALAPLPERAARTRPGPATALAAAEDLRFLGLDAEAADALRASGETARDLAAAFTAAELARRGGDAETALVLADQVVRRLPAGYRREALPRQLGELLYPDPWPGLVERAASEFAIDPDLVRAVMREESRFDPGALSAAGARGLMQFIPETARRVGHGIGLGVVAPADLHAPEVAIPLGAAYLAELLALFGGREGPAVAAYNAGEESAYRWLERTRRGDLDEFLREVEYDETRAYVDRVLTSLAAYRGRRAEAEADPQP